MNAVRALTPRQCGNRLRMILVVGSPGMIVSHHISPSKMYLTWMVCASSTVNAWVASAWAASAWDALLGSRYGFFFRRRLQIQLVAHRDRLAALVDGLTQDSRRFLSRMKAFAVFADDVIQSPHRFALQFTNRAVLFLDRATGLHLDDCVEHFRHRRSGPVDQRPRAILDQVDAIFNFLFGNVVAGLPGLY